MIELWNGFWKERFRGSVRRFMHHDNEFEKLHNMGQRRTIGTRYHLCMMKLEHNIGLLCNAMMTE